MDIKNALTFLSKLKRNNRKEWFDKNKPGYLEIKGEFEELVGKFIKELGKADDSVKALEAKNCLFRIYKDVRFSKDKTPYKTHIGAYIAQDGRKSEYAGYYLHIEPGASFLAGGIWMPEADVLKGIRQEIDYNSKDFLKVIRNTTFKKYFGDIQGEKLSRNPKEYSSDHPQIEYLKFKSFNVVHELTDKKVTASDFVKSSVTIYKAMKPLNDFLNAAVKEARTADE
jgi:uncharacterized protein (TIGR02453 family)